MEGVGLMQWGRCDYKQLQKLQQNLQKLQSMDLTRFCEEASRELAARLLALVIPRTPVGKYPKRSGRKGGTLRLSLIHISATSRVAVLQPA